MNKKVDGFVPVPPAYKVERLIALARELSAIETLQELREALRGCLRPFLPSSDMCVLTAADGAWETIIGPNDAQQRKDAYAWTPLVAGRRTVGMLGIGITEGGLSGGLTDAAAALLGMGIQHILAMEDLKQNSARDTLTGCFNRGHAIEMLEGQMRRATRSTLPVSILMMDIDGFKDINDRYGHVAGDAVLAAVGNHLVRRLRQSDIRCRFGGDEFLIILPDTALGAAMGVADGLRRALEQIEVPSPRGTVTITASVGVAATNRDDVDMSAFIDRADSALYKAKQAGRNRVRAYRVVDVGAPAQTQWNEARPA